MFGETMERMLDHLEFLGYSIERKQKFAQAEHDLHPNLTVKTTAGGVMFST